jgi:alkylation response protein AidB-like acyl-CoA dehydrogenase
MKVTGGRKMVDFTLTEEQQQLRNLVHRFAQGEISPVAAELDREQRFSQEIVDKYYEIGLLHGTVP